ncbi:MAG: 2OG-Fe(II) oxygenase [Halieaceae bacterium]|jgi:SM-20-related protein|nr:2OG-Fe(II) oxygenase [Halieaceae bacterium]
MIPATSTPVTGNAAAHSEQLFANIADDLLAKGYSINPCALPAGLADELLLQLHTMSQQQFAPAGIGREQDQMLNRFVRKDEICWITGASAAGRRWLDWTGELQAQLNRRLFLGLFSFESHFAHYREGAFYRRHLDAFKGESNRVLSLVAYLNPGWLGDDGGELVIYPEKGATGGIRVTPAFGTLVAFLSEDFEHEVLPARRDRYSVAGWFRVNGSSARRADPPL